MAARTEAPDSTKAPQVADEGNGAQLPLELQTWESNPHAKRILLDLIALGGSVAGQKEVDAQAAARKQFEDRIDGLLHDSTAEFLRQPHPTYGVNWLGFVRHLIGPAVGGKSELPFSHQPRGVGDRSGRKRS